MAHGAMALGESTTALDFVRQWRRRGSDYLYAEDAGQQKCC
jgi:hypothetical protein